jgi:hypothetical protein
MIFRLVYSYTQIGGANKYSIWGTDNYVYCYSNDGTGNGEVQGFDLQLTNLLGVTTDIAGALNVGSVCAFDDSYVWCCLPTTAQARVYSFNGSSFTNIRNPSLVSANFVARPIATDGTWTVLVDDSKLKSYTYAGNTRSTWATPATDLCFFGGYLYATQGASGLAAFSIGAGGVFTRIDYDTSHTGLTNVRADANYVYAWGDDGIFVYTFDGTTLTEVFSRTTESWSAAATTYMGLLNGYMLCSGYTGFHIYKVHPVLGIKKVYSGAGLSYMWCGNNLVYTISGTSVLAYTLEPFNAQVQVTWQP